MRSRPEPATRLEMFLASCSLCIRDWYPVATLVSPPLRPPGIPQRLLNMMERGGEARFEVVRAYARADRGKQVWAMGVSLFQSVSGGSPYRLAAGLLDEEDLPELAAALSEMTKLLAVRERDRPAGETTVIDFRGGSIRIGVLRTEALAVAYIQAGDVQSLTPPTELGALDALFFPVSDLGALDGIVRQVATKIQELRRGQR